MKYCDRPFDFMWVTRTFDGKEKQMTLPCSWLTITGGDDTDLSIHSVDEVWYGDTFNKVRDSIIDGSFRYCNCATCPFITNDTLPDLTEEEFMAKTCQLEYPTKFDLAFDRACNHACPSCRSTLYKNTKELEEEIDVVGKKLLPYLNRAEFIDSNGQGDFFASSANMKLFSKIEPENENIQINIETNGTLFNEYNWQKIQHLKKYDISVSITPNSFERETYAYLNGGFDLLEALEKNLDFVSTLRKQGDIKRFVLVAVVQESNVKEIPSFVETCLNRYEVDEVILRPIFKWNFLTEEDHWFKNVANPLHPYHKYYEKLFTSGLFDNPKVYNWGCTLDVKPQQHPAYLYKEVAELQCKIVQMEDIEQRINQYFNGKGVKRIIVYGQDVLSKTMTAILKHKEIEVEIVDELYQEKLKNYIFPEDSALLITNFYHKDSIIRDLGFMQYKGEIIVLSDMLNEIEKM